MTHGYRKLSQKERERLHIIRQVISGEIRQADAAELLSLSTRQVRRLTTCVKSRGDAGIIHKSRGRRSNNSYPKRIRDKAVALYSKKYRQFSLSDAVIKLAEFENINIHSETLRRWLIRSGEWEGNGNNKIDEKLIRADKFLQEITTVKIFNSELKMKRSKISPKVNKKNGRHSKKETENEKVVTRSKKYIPAPDHPWRRTLYPEYADKYTDEV